MEKKPWPGYSRPLGSPGPSVGDEMKGAPARREPVPVQIFLGPAHRAVRLTGYLVHSGGLNPERVPLNPDWIIGNTFQNPAAGTILLETYGLERGWYELIFTWTANVMCELLFQVMQGDNVLKSHPFHLVVSSQVLPIPGPLPMEYGNRIRVVQNTAGVVGFVTVSVHLRQVL